MNTTKAQKVTKRGRENAHKAAAVFAFQESRSDIKKFKVSKKMSAPIAIAAPVKIVLSVIAEVVVDVRLLVLLEVKADISDITLATRTC